MSTKNQPGYPLPSGDLGDDDITCQLVFIPDRPEYWQAFIAAYHYMSTWRAWERDDDHRGKDAASDWRIAFEMTMECWRMACLENLQDDIAEILEVLKTHACCEGGDPTDGDQYTDPVVDGEGDVPQNIIDAGYASGTSDWEGFDDYKCMAAHLVVDSMEAKLRKLAPHVDSAAKVYGGIATLAIIVTTIWTGGLTLLVAGLVAATGAAALMYENMISGSALVTLADKVATNHDSLACAFYFGDGSQDAIGDLKDEIDTIFSATEAIILKTSGVAIDAKALYAGRYDQKDVAEELADRGYDVGDFDCTCTEEGAEELEHDFLTVKPSWLSGSSVWFATKGNPPGSLKQTQNIASILTANKAMTETGYTVEAGDMVEITRFVCDHMRSLTQSKFEIIYDDGSEHVIYTCSEEPRDTFYPYDVEYDPPIEIDPNSGGKFYTKNTGSGGGSYVDNWHIYFTVKKA